jgi:glycosyltransferase involved in cell wall biosynthesis
MPRVLVNLLQTTGTKGGIEVYVRELYRAVGALDSNFEFIGFASSELSRADSSWFPGTVIDSGISGENRLAWARGELFAVARAAREQRVDLLHGPAMFGPLSLAIPSVITVHDLLYFSNPGLMQTKLFTGPVKWMERRGAAGATRLITISETSATAIRRFLRFPDSHIDVIPLAARSSAVASKKALPRKRDQFLAMGQRSPYKNFETIVRAWSRMPESTRPRLVITGGGTDDPLRPLVTELGLAPWVDLRDWVTTEELAELIATSTALIDSTLATGFSLPALEAMQAGLPVLLADTPIFREVGGEAADYFAAGNPEALSQAVAALSSDPARRDALTSLGRERAAQTSWSVVAERTLESFTRAISEGKRR